MLEIIKGVGGLIAILVTIGGLFNTLFSTFSYDSFDIKLMPRNKSSIVKVKKIISSFVIVIPIFIVAAYVNAFAFFSHDWLVNLVYIVLLILMILYILSILLSGLEWFLNKLSVLKKLKGIQKIIKMFDYLFRMNIKIKDKIIFSLSFVLLILIAGQHLSTNPISNYSGRQDVIEALIVILIMSIIILVLLIPIFMRKRSVEYTYLIDISTVQDLIKEIGDECPLNLEYFLSDTISVFSSKDQEYRVIKRLDSESIYQYEVYKKRN